MRDGTDPAPFAQGAIEHAAVKPVEVRRDADGQGDGHGGDDGPRHDAEEEAPARMTRPRAPASVATSSRVAERVSARWMAAT